MSNVMPENVLTRQHAKELARKYFWKLLSWFLHCHLREGSPLVAGAPAGCAISVVSAAGGGSSGLTLGLQASPRSSAAAVSASLPPRG